MSHVMQASRGPSMGAHHLIGAAINVAMLLCWAGILPAWRLAPTPIQPALLADLQTLLAPALALSAGVLFVLLLRVAGAQRSLFGRLAVLTVQVAGILFACLALRAVAGLPWGGYGVGWALLGAALQAGAVLATFLLPLAALLAALGGLIGIFRREWRAARAA